jgi:hypothetical protein
MWAFFVQVREASFMQSVIGSFHLNVTCLIEDAYI